MIGTLTAIDSIFWWLAVFAGTLGGFSIGALVILLKKEPPHESAVQTPALHFQRTWRPMTPAELSAAFVEWSESDPKWRAVWDLLSHHLEAELGTMEGMKSDPYAIAQANGRLQALLFIRSQMLALRKRP